MEGEADRLPTLDYLRLDCAGYLRVSQSFTSNTITTRTAHWHIVGAHAGGRNRPRPRPPSLCCRYHSKYRALIHLFRRAIFLLSFLNPLVMMDGISAIYPYYYIAYCRIVGPGGPVAVGV